MAFNQKNCLVNAFSTMFKTFVRARSQRRTLGKPPELARTLKERLEEVNKVDPNVFYKVDIGFPLKKKIRKEILSQQLNMLKTNKKDPEMERLSRKNQLVIPLEEVDKDWFDSVGPLQIKMIADHYSIYDHLFGDAFFYPSINIDIHYQTGSMYSPVFRGNILKPDQAKQKPEVKFTPPPDSLWTLTMCSPDGHFTSENSEYIHWLVGNIQGGDISSGELVVDYLQPFPVKGGGYFRYIFVLYKQDRKLDFSLLKTKYKSENLEGRTFSTYDFYRERQDLMTPAGLAFFQADWDSSVTDFFHKVLDKEEPEFRYDFPTPYHPKQKWFPLKHAFNLYMDRYRDEKQIAKEYLLRKLKKEHPFKGREPPLRFPNIVPFKKGTPTWLKLERTKDRRGWGRVNDY